MSALHHVKQNEYELVHPSCWVKVYNRLVYIGNTGKGVEVLVYAQNDDEPLTGCYQEFKTGGA